MNHQGQLLQQSSLSSSSEKGNSQPAAEPHRYSANAVWSVWDDKAVATMLRLWEDGKTATQIARELGPDFTRNSIIGKLNRLGYRRVRKPKHPQEIRASKTPRGNRPRLVVVRSNGNSNAMKVISSVERGPLNIRAVEIESRNINLADLAPGECRYPYGDGPFTFCGHPVRFGSSYCAAHHELCWMPPTRSNQLARGGR